MYDNWFPLLAVWKALTISLLVLILNKILTKLHEVKQLFSVTPGIPGVEEQFQLAPWVQSLDGWIDRILLGASILLLFLASRVVCNLQKGLAWMGTRDMRRGPPQVLLLSDLGKGVSTWNKS